MTIQSYRRARIRLTPAPARAPPMPPTRRLQGSKDYESITHIHDLILAQLNLNIHKEELQS